MPDAFISYTGSQGHSGDIQLYLGNVGFLIESKFYSKNSVDKSEVEKFYFDLRHASRTKSIQLNDIRDNELH